MAPPGLRLQRLPSGASSFSELPSRALPSFLRCSARTMRLLAAVGCFVVSSWRGSPFCAGKVANRRLVRRTHHYPDGGGRLFFLHHGPDLGPTQVAERHGRPQSQGFTSTAADPERFELGCSWHAGHAG